MVTVKKNLRLQKLALEINADVEYVLLVILELNALSEVGKDIDHERSADTGGLQKKQGQGTEAKGPDAAQDSAQTHYKPQNIHSNIHISTKNNSNID